MTEEFSFDRTHFLRPSRLKFSLLLLMSLAFTAIGVAFGISKGDLSMWLCAAFFGVGSIVFAMMLLPNSAYLKLSEEGFEMRSLFRSNTYKWSEVKNFRTVYVPPAKTLVGFDFTPEYTKHPNWRTASKVIADCEGALPDTYGRSADQLARLLNVWHLHFAN